MKAGVRGMCICSLGLILAALLLGACGSEDPQPAADITGAYVQTTDAGVTRIVLASDGTVEVFTVQNGSVSPTGQGTYTVDGTSVTLTIPQQSTGVSLTQTLVYRDGALRAEIEVNGQQQMGVVWERE